MKREWYEFILLHNTWKTDQMEKREIDIDIWEEREWSCIEKRATMSFSIEVS